MFSLNLSSIKQVLFLLCLFALSWQYVTFNEAFTKYKVDSADLENRIDSLHMQTNKIAYLRDIQDEKTQQLRTEFFKIDSLKKVNASNSSWTDSELEKVNTLIEEMRLSDSVNQVYNFVWYSDSVYTELLNNQNLRLNERETLNRNQYKKLLIPFIILIAFFFDGILKENKLKDLNSFTELYKKGRVWLNCQSCGKNFSVKRGNANNADGTKNYAYCKECFRNGVFTNAYTTIDDVKLQILAQFNNPTPKLIRAVEAYTKSLQRWNEDEYKSLTMEDYFNEEATLHKPTFWKTIKSFFN